MADWERHLFPLQGGREIGRVKPKIYQIETCYLLPCVVIGITRIIPLIASEGYWVIVFAAWYLLFGKHLYSSECAKYQGTGLPLMFNFSHLHCLITRNFFKMITYHYYIWPINWWCIWQRSCIHCARLFVADVLGSFLRYDSKPLTLNSTCTIPSSTSNYHPLLLFSYVFLLNEGPPPDCTGCQSPLKLKHI